MEKPRKMLLRTTMVLLATILLYGALLTPPINVCDGQVQTPKYGGTLVRTFGAQPAHLNLALSNAGWIFTQEIYDVLVRIDFNVTPHPDLAETWEVSPDLKTYTFHLVHNATWHDGVPVTSADVKFSIEKVISVYHNVKSNWALLDRVDTPDDYTAVIVWKKPNPTVWTWIGSPTRAGVIIPKHIFENSTGSLDAMLKNPASLAPIGSGAFMFKEWVSGDHVTFVRNPNYFYSDLPYLDQIIVRFIPDIATRATAFEAKELGLYDYYGFPMERMAGYMANPNMHAWVCPGNAVPDWLYINLRRAPLDNVKVRQAIAYAINREDILSKGFYGYGVVGTTMLCSSQPGWTTKGVTIYSYNATKANELLDQAGYPRGSDGTRFTFDVIYDYSVLDYVAIAQIMRDNLADVGIKLTLRPMDRATHYSVGAAWEFDTCLYRPAAGIDPSALSTVLNSINIQHAMGLNMIGYNNSQYDELDNLAIVETNATKRLEYYQQLQVIANHDLPIINVYETVKAGAMWNDFAIYTPAGWTALNGVNDEFLDMFGLYTYSTKGTEVSATSVQQAMTDAELKIEALSAQNYDVSKAMRKLNDARSAFKIEDATTWAGAQAAAKAAESLVTAPPTPEPPYALYAAMAAGWVVAVILGILAFRFRRREKT